MTFTCGHGSDEPRFMGRGQARQRRLAEYFNRPCVVCAEVHLRTELSKLTDMQGNLRPATDEKVREKVARLQSRY